MEACSSAQYWARELQQLGHTVKLLSPQFGKPDVKGNKNDSRDAEAICEAVSRPPLRFVPLKTVESQDIQAIHRMRSRLIKERTALVNQIRGLLAERGIVIAQGITRLRKQLPVRRCQLICTDAISRERRDETASSFPQAARAGIVISRQIWNLFASS
jgi:transposase